MNFPILRKASLSSSFSTMAAAAAREINPFKLAAKKFSRDSFPRIGRQNLWTRDDVFDELRTLLISMGEECDVLTFVDQPDAPTVRRRGQFVTQ